MQAQTPFLVAHRAGNDLDALRGAEQLGVRQVEADLRLRRRRIEVRHARRVGPVLWDAGRVARARRAPLRLEDLLESVAPGTELLLDLKGRDRRLSQRLHEAIDPYLDSRRINICARAWSLLEPFQHEHRVRLIYSIGDDAQLEAFLARFADAPVDGVSVDERLVDPDIAARLRARAGVVLCWTVNATSRARELVNWGVHGLTTDDPAALHTEVLAAAA